MSLRDCLHFIGKKMELRLFVAITSVEPLSVYLYSKYTQSSLQLGFRGRL